MDKNISIVNISYKMSDYSILGLDTNASIDQVKKAYKKLALIYHPDKNKGCDEKFQKIKNAYENITMGVSFTNNTFDINAIIKSFYSFYTYTHCLFENNIVIDIDVTMQDIYYHNVKKINIKVKRGNEYTFIDLYISLLVFQNQYIFKEMGDDFIFCIKGKKRNDVHVNINVVEDSIVKHTDLVNKYDIYIDKKIDFYEYLYENSFDIEFFKEKVRVEKNEKGTFVVIENKGLPYLDSDDNIVRGDLYVYFVVDIHPKNKSILLDEKFKQQIYTTFSLK